MTGKLKPCNGKWTVAVIIEDDCGGQLDVELSNHVRTCRYILVLKLNCIVKEFVLIGVCLTIK